MQQPPSKNGSLDVCAAEKLRAVLIGKYYLFIYIFHVLGQTTLIRDNLFYFGTSGHDPWIRDGPKKNLGHLESLDSSARCEIEILLYQYTYVPVIV